MTSILLDSNANGLQGDVSGAPAAEVSLVAESAETVTAAAAAAAIAAYQRADPPADPSYDESGVGEVVPAAHTAFSDAAAAESSEVYAQAQAQAQAVQAAAAGHAVRAAVALQARAVEARMAAVAAAEKAVAAASVSIEGPAGGSGLVRVAEAPVKKRKVSKFNSEEERKQARLQKNRRTAEESRQRRMRKMNDLQATVDAFAAREAQLLAQIDALKSDNAMLRAAAAGGTSGAVV